MCTALGNCHASALHRLRNGLQEAFWARLSCSHTDDGGSHPLARPFGTTYVRWAAGGRVWTPYTALDNHHAFARRPAVQRLPGDQLGPS